MTLDTSTPSPPADTNTPVPSQTPSETNTPVPTATATNTPRPTDHKQLGADIVTASGYAFGDGGAPMAVNPSDTFSLDAGHAYAIIHIDNLPKKASVGARWTFPNGNSFDIKVGGHFSSYWIVGEFADTGLYTVSALVNGKPVGSHAFEVTSTRHAKAKKSKKNKETPNTNTDQIAPAAELARAVVPARNTLYSVSPIRARRWREHGRARGLRSRPAGRRE
jgi:hypothetical protein